MQFVKCWVSYLAHIICIHQWFLFYLHCTATLSIVSEMYPVPCKYQTCIYSLCVHLRCILAIYIYRLYQSYPCPYRMYLYLPHLCYSSSAVSPVSMSPVLISPVSLVCIYLTCIPLLYIKNAENELSGMQYNITYAMPWTVWHSSGRHFLMLCAWQSSELCQCE